MTGSDLRALRTAHGLTQAQVAQALGYNTNYLARLERGDVPMTPRCARLITTFFTRAVVLSRTRKAFAC
jgi:transcriptional regulator with XRE-family HTH domain